MVSEDYHGSMIRDSFFMPVWIGDYLYISQEIEVGSWKN